MKPKIPKSIKQQVIKQWLQGAYRDQIAKDNVIGARTVTAIINDSKIERTSGIATLQSNYRRSPGWHFILLYDIRLEN